MEFVELGEVGGVGCSCCFGQDWLVWVGVSWVGELGGVGCF